MNKSEMEQHILNPNLELNVIRAENRSYWNSYLDQPTFKLILGQVFGCLEVAGKHGGRVFGGFVRNILIPMAFKRELYGYKDVDLWFTTKENANSFLAEMCDRLAEFPDQKFQATKVEYPFERIQKVLKGCCGIYRGVIIDVIISKDCPVDDFDVNQLAYSPTEDYKSFGMQSTSQLVKAFYMKQATMLPGYSVGDRGSQRYQIQTKRINKLIECGWTIFDQSGKIYSV